ncbi:Signal peptidase complex catalytic subunit [Brettanomyces nanus]|uniref:Signal peptidase complex catalytic subunit SEC11 n=1 Tax=Eeniella nana TaxID=13502 RepID=A0A875S6J4_EENNA|nr:Signal peptidase complex catalytic subunit [Brettanomyces nanus]QPG76956.1 Signal peptidase complex catalytic subunit [Brettanomyces nanus]
MNLKTLRIQLNQGLVMSMVLASAFAVWKLMSVITMSNSPLVVVLSGSMEPAFQRGDILLLWNREKYLNVGDIIVYKTSVRDVPIVHRIVREHVIEDDLPKRKTGKNKSTVAAKRKSQKILTKGDNNQGDDLPLYEYNVNYLDRQKDILGSVKGYIPKVGYVTILITENKYFKYAIVGLLALSALFNQE